MTATAPGRRSMNLIKPTQDHLPSYVNALRNGWAPDHGSAADILAQIDASPEAFLNGFDDPQALGTPVHLPDGSYVPRLPGIARWMWDGEYCGSIGLRWSRGTVELPPWCLGHIGYSVVKPKRRRGYATSALAQILPEARRIGLPYVELVTDVDNVYSQRVVLANGGKLVEQFEKLPQNGGGQALRFRISL